MELHAPTHRLLIPLNSEEGYNFLKRYFTRKWSQQDVDGCGGENNRLLDSDFFLKSVLYAGLSGSLVFACNPIRLTCDSPTTPAPSGLFHTSSPLVIVKMLQL